MNKVYIKTNEKGYVIALNSDAFIENLSDWMQIDEGDGDRYHHAQGNYLPQPLMTEDGIYRYKLVHGQVQERTADEIHADVDALPPPPPSPELLAKAGVAAYQSLLSNNVITDAVASTLPTLAPEMAYTGKSIPANTRIQWDYGDGPVVVKAKVTLWDRADQNPANAPTLWDVLQFKDGHRIIPEVITAELAFGKGEIGYWPADGKFYKAKRAGVVHTPAAYPADWEEVYP